MAGAAVILGFAAGPAAALSIAHPGASSPTVAVDATENTNAKGPDGSVNDGKGNPINGAWEGADRSSDTAPILPGNTP